MKSVKRILHVHASNKFSGAENVSCTIIKNLDDSCQAAYCSPDGPIAKHLKSESIDFIPLPKLTPRHLRKVIKTFKPDVIHAHDFKASLICSIVNKDAVLIEHIHNNDPKLRRITLKSLAFLYSSQKATNILTVSPAVEQAYIFSKQIHNKIICIDNPMEAAKIKENATIKSPTKKYDICCVARLSPQKNPDLFLDILSTLKKSKPNIKAVWVGAGTLTNQQKNIIQTNQLEKNIDFVGFQENPYNYIIQSKVFVLTSSWEGFGLAAFEASSLGLPCVVSNVGGLPKIIDKQNGFLCDSKQDFVNNINIALDNYKQYATTSYQKALKLSNLNTYMQNINKIYINQTPIHAAIFKHLLYKNLEFFDNFCRKNDIQYSLIGGSLIGAVREKGIIPWDDDIDVILTKQNYEKLIKLTRTHQDKRYKFLSHETNAGYNFPFLKLVDTYTTVTEPQIQHPIPDYGIYIDIFWYLPTSDIPKKQRAHHHKINTFTKMCNTVNINYDDASFTRQFARRLKNFTINILRPQNIINKLQREYNRYNINDKDAQNYMISCWPIYSADKEIQTASSINSGYIDTQFGPVKAMIFREYDTILRTTFGDYMTPPAKKDRHIHGLQAYWRPGHDSKDL